jgi:hypothetical protein
MVDQRNDIDRVQRAEVVGFAERCRKYWWVWLLFGALLGLGRVIIDKIVTK